MFESFFKLHKKEDISYKKENGEDLTEVDTSTVLDSKKGEEKIDHAIDDEYPILLNMFEEKNNIIIYAEVPNIDLSSIRIYVAGKNVNLEGFKKIEGPDDFIMKEIKGGKYSRSINLESYIDETNSSAIYNNAIIKITFQKLEVNKTKQIPLREK